MGSGWICGPKMRWGLPFGGATLLLLLLPLLPAAAGQDSPGVACSQNTNRTCQECLKNVSWGLKTLDGAGKMCQMISAPRRGPGFYKALNPCGSVVGSKLVLWVIGLACLCRLNWKGRLAVGMVVQCLWCNTDNTCVDYPVTKILPPASLCKLSSARWGVCWVNFEALIIAMSVIGGLILLAVAVCCCYCCCGKKKSRKPDKSEEKAMREQEERRIRQEERRAEMKSRHDEIRKKYGLFKTENPYARFENN